MLWLKAQRGKRLHKRAECNSSGSESTIIKRIIIWLPALPLSAVTCIKHFPVTRTQSQQERFSKSSAGCTAIRYKWSFCRLHNPHARAFCFLFLREDIASSRQCTPKLRDLLSHGAQHIKSHLSLFFPSSTWPAEGLPRVASPLIGWTYTLLIGLLLCFCHPVCLYVASFLHPRSRVPRATNASKVREEKRVFIVIRKDFKTWSLQKNNLFFNRWLMSQCGSVVSALV